MSALQTLHRCLLDSQTLLIPGDKLIKALHIGGIRLLYNAGIAVEYLLVQVLFQALGRIFPQQIGKI